MPLPDREFCSAQVDRVFAISAGGFGPGIIQNFISASNEPINSSAAPATPGQAVVIWGTGLGPVTFPDNVAPNEGNVATPVSVTVGGQPASVLYSGRSPCCSGVDQIVVTLANNVPLGRFVPVTINAVVWFRIPPRWPSPRRARRRAAIPGVR